MIIIGHLLRAHSLQFTLLEGQPLLAVFTNIYQMNRCDETCR